MCSSWLRSVAQAKETGKTEKLLKKWNESIEKPKATDADEDGEADEESNKSKRGRSSKRSGGSTNGDSTRSRGRSVGSAVDPEAVKLFFSGKAEEQLNLKQKSKRTHRLTFVVTPRSASAGSTRKRKDGEA